MRTASAVVFVAVAVAVTLACATGAHATTSAEATAKALSTLKALRSGVSAGDNTGAFPSEVLDLMDLDDPPSCWDVADFVSLLQRDDMMDRRVDLLLDVPFASVAPFVLQPNLYPTWNSDYTAVQNTQFAECDALNATFTTRINATFPSGAVFGAPTIVLVNATDTALAIGWQFTLRDGATGDIIYFGAHFYYWAQTPYANGRASKFISWQKVGGAFVAANRAAFELGLSRTVQRPDALGAVCLEKVSIQLGAPAVLPPEAVAAACTSVQI